MLKAIQYIEKYNMISEQDCVIVGVSGGADSVCLLFVLCALQETLPFSIVVVHVEHGIRGEESLKDAEFVENLCRKLGVRFVKYSYDIRAAAKVQHISVEEAGRNARYEAFTDALNKNGGTRIAVAHNKNDQAETILWNLTRGTGLRGMGGTKPVRGNIIRPLLGVSRKEIEEYLFEKGITYCTDQTNLSDDYTRNKLRLHVLPYLEKELNHNAVSHIAEAGMHLQKVEAYMEETARREAKSCIYLEEKGKNQERYQGKLDKKGTMVYIRVNLMLEKPQVIREYLFRHCLELAGCGLKDIGSVHIESLENLLWVQSGREAHLPGGFVAKRSQDSIWIGAERVSQEHTAMELQIPGTYRYSGKRVCFTTEFYENQNIEEKTYTKWLDYDKISSTICLRSRQSGDYFVVNQDGGKKKLKAYYIDKKIPQEERDNILLLAEGAHVLWIVGYRISEAYKVTRDTKRLLKIQVMEEEDNE